MRVKAPAISKASGHYKAKASGDAERAPQTNALLPRPFKAPAQPSAAPPKDGHEAHGAGGAGERESQSGHNFGRVKVGADLLRQRAGGRALPARLRLKMEAAFKTDFSAVRVHEDDNAASLGADAFTRGHDLHFASGTYEPGSSSGQKLIGHELTHVVQQRGGGVPAPQGKGAPVNANPRLEAEADALGSKAAQGKPVTVQTGRAETKSLGAKSQPVGSPVAQCGKGDKGHKKLGRQAKRNRDKLPEDVRRGAHAYKQGARMGAADQLNRQQQEEIRQGNAIAEQHRQQQRARGAGAGAAVAAPAPAPVGRQPRVRARTLRKQRERNPQLFQQRMAQQRQAEANRPGMLAWALENAKQRQAEAQKAKEGRSEKEDDPTSSDDEVEFSAPDTSSDRKDKRRDEDDDSATGGGRASLSSAAAVTVN